MSNDWGNAPFIPARPTLYKGIRMRSRLEADFAAFLDRMEAEWAYEPECFAGDGGQWLPDFGFAPHDGRYSLYVEVKPFGLLREWGDECHARVTAIMRRMEIARQTYARCHLWLYFWDYGDDGDSMLMASFADDLAWRVSVAGLPSSVGLLWPDSPLG